MLDGKVKRSVASNKQALCPNVGGIDHTKYHTYFGTIWHWALFSKASWLFCIGTNGQKKKECDWYCRYFAVCSWTGNTCIRGGGHEHECSVVWCARLNEPRTLVVRPSRYVARLVYGMSWQSPNWSRNLNRTKIANPIKRKLAGSFEDITMPSVGLNPCTWVWV